MQLCETADELCEREAGMFWCSHLAVQKSVMFISVPTGSSVPPGEIQRTHFMPQTITQLAFRLLLTAFQSIDQAFILTSFLPFSLLVSHLFFVILFPPFVLFWTGPFPFHPSVFVKVFVGRKTQKSPLAFHPALTDDFRASHPTANTSQRH